MKTADLFKKISAVAAAVLTIAACTKEVPESGQTQTPAGPYTFEIGGATKTLLSQDDRGHFALWEAGDRIGTMITSGGSVTPGHAGVNPGKPSSFSLYHVGGFEAGDMVRAYYPYNSASTGLDNVVLSIPVSQVQNADVFDFDSMPMVSEPYEITQAVTDTYNPVGEIYFNNVAAVAEFRIFSSNGSWAGESVSSVRFESTSPLAGEFTMDISAATGRNPESLAISGYTAMAVTTAVNEGLAVPSGQSSAASVFMVLAPGTYGGTVIVTTDKAEYHFPLKSSQTFKRSVIRALGVDLGSCTDRRGGATPVTVTKTFKQILTAMGQGSAANGTKFEILTLDDVITIETNGYNNCGKSYSSATQWRVYAADYGNIKIKAAPGYELQSVTLTYNIAASSGTNPEFLGPASNTATPVSGCSVTYHIVKGVGNLQFTKFSVTYIESSFKPDRVYLDCYEMPAVEVAVSATGNETFGDDIGTGKWHEFDLQDQDRRVITHTFLSGTHAVRNYTSMMDRTKRCPLWVAYPMHGSVYSNQDVGRGSFDERTSYDPAIPASWMSSGSTYDAADKSAKSDYSRGHLCASEDRQNTTAANKQTFYYSNQAPQWQNSFNSGIWGSLETAAQNKAAALVSRDTLYVVSGTLYEDGVFGPSNDDMADGGVVARPSHFYKLLMLCSFDASGTMTSAAGSAYLYENREHKDKKYYDEEYKTTIDALELRTGFDFFASVPPGLQEAAESDFTILLDEK